MSMNTSSIPPDVAQEIGPLLLGNLVNWGLFGTLTVQIYIYYIAFPKDSYLLKCAVGFAYIVELLQTILSTRDAFKRFASGWGDPSVLVNNDLLWFCIPILESIMSCFSQLIYAWRISVLSGNYRVSGVISLLAVVQGGFGLYSGVFAGTIDNLPEVQRRDYRTTAVWLGGSVLCDVIITCSMIYYLQKAKTGIKRTTTMLTRLIKLTVETGFICATFAILTLSLFVAFRQGNYFLFPSIALGKLYSNSLLVIFNARVQIVGGRNIVDPEDVSLSTFTVSSQKFRLTKGIRSRNIPVSGIAVEVTQVRDVDIRLRPVTENSIELNDVGKNDLSSGEFDIALQHEKQIQQSTASFSPV